MAKLEDNPFVGFFRFCAVGYFFWWCVATSTSAPFVGGGTWAVVYTVSMWLMCSLFLIRQSHVLAVVLLAGSLIISEIRDDAAGQMIYWTLPVLSGMLGLDVLRRKWKALGQLMRQPVFYLSLAFFTLQLMPVAMSPEPLV
ncbi:MAG: hypothetical protein AAF570_28030 [Bacteroidota bacterium]